MKNQTKKIKVILATFCVFQLLNFNLNAQGWESINTPVSTNLILYDISFPDGQNDIGFVGGSNVTYNGKGKILKTEDQGSNWTIIYESDINGTGVTSIFFMTPEHGFAGTMGGNVMTTTDGGSNWTSVDIAPSVDQGEVGDLEFWDANNGVAVTIWGGIYVTTDGGATWTVATSNYIGAYDVAYADQNTLFAVGGDQKIFRSTDKGVNWTEVFDGPMFQAVNLGVHFSDSNNGLVTSEDGNVFITADGGNTWTNYIASGQVSLMRGAWVFDENNMYAAGTPGQVFKTTDGGMTWTLDSAIDPNPSYYKIKFTENGTGFVCGSGSTGGTILRKLALTVANAETTDVSCNGGADGSIIIEVSGGVDPYTYLWSNDETTTTITDLPAGTYTCTITDSDGATIVSDTYVISEPDAIISTTTVTDESLAGASDGAIDLSVSGGIPGYIFSWSNGESTEDISNLSPGEYCCTITDLNGCSQTTCATVLDGPLSTNLIEDLTLFTVSPNPVLQGDVFVALQFSSKKDIHLSLYNSLGQEVYFSKQLDVLNSSTQIDLSDFSPGTYFIKVTSLNDNKIATAQIIKN